MSDKSKLEHKESVLRQLYLKGFQERISGRTCDWNYSTGSRSGMKSILSGFGEFSTVTKRKQTIKLGLTFKKNTNANSNKII